MISRRQVAPLLVAASVLAGCGVALLALVTPVARAVDALLLDTPKNVYRPSGHNYQRPGLTLYLPGNGGLLYAVAMMAAGWEGGPERPSPGFPDDGSWVVRAEGLMKAF